MADIILQIHGAAKICTAITDCAVFQEKMTSIFGIHCAAQLCIKTVNGAAFHYESAFKPEIHGSVSGYAGCYDAAVRQRRIIPGMLTGRVGVL